MRRSAVQVRVSAPKKSPSLGLFLAFVFCENPCARLMVVREDIANFEKNERHAFAERISNLAVFWDWSHHMDTKLVAGGHLDVVGIGA